MAHLSYVVIFELLRWKLIITQPPSSAPFVRILPPTFTWRMQGALIGHFNARKTCVVIEHSN